MKINLHAGHGPAGGKGCGAVGLINESTEARKVTEKVIAYLKAQGHTVYDCTVNENTSPGTILTKIVKKCNAHAVDLDVSIHFNSGRKDPKGDGSIGGTEVLVYNTGGQAEKYAAKIAASIAKLGFRNRGVKVRKDLYFLNSTKAPALLIEVVFVDDADDVKLYKQKEDQIAAAIVEAITGKVVVAKNETTISKKETVAEKNSATGKDSSVVAPFMVRVKVNELNIRRGPGTEYDTVGKIKDKGTYTIVKTNDDGKWGHLKSGKGWINISPTYCDKV